MVAPWAVEEVKNVDLQDKRLNDRLTAVLDQLGGRPTASIPAACGGRAETAAAYRFFNNEKVGFENVLQPHCEASSKRMADHPVVILVQDATQIDLTRPEQQVEGVGPLDVDSRRGVFLHPLIGFTPDGTPLGTVYAEAWTRADAAPAPRTQRQAERRYAPIEEKESMRWLDAYRQAREQAERLPQTQLVCVADSEADVYEVIEEAQQEPRRLDWIIRAGHNRAVRQSDDEGETTKKLLREQAMTGDVLFNQTLAVRGRKAKISNETRGRRRPRDSRHAEVEVRAARVTLRAPWRPGRQLGDVPVNVALVTEVDPPEGDAPVEWILLTSLPIDDADQVRTVVQYYCVRWMIEVFFRTLKSGCRVEERRFEHVDRLLPCLAVYLIVTWRTLFVGRLGREHPEISCEAVFERAEWKSVYHVVNKRPAPSTPPKLQEMVRMVAQLGGYMPRQRTDEPGPQTVWLGLQRAHDIANCWLTFGPEAANRPKLV